ncbi:hypothetical protein G5B39_05755 [Rhodobacteraceae bacterium SC52]|nr:hypothetical protein G5B39_05755 [Rhodobacteraceae bacterium SC52]
MTSLSSTCDLCGAADDLAPLPVTPRDTLVTLCPVCTTGAAGDIQDKPHWRCLGDAIWSERSEVQVVAWRLLTALDDTIWARDILETVYLAPETEAWAQDGLSFDAPDVTHKDSNGVVLAQGDTVTLIKDLNVKGAGFTAKRGTAVRGISLVPDNAAQIEGRVNGQHIVILCEFVKKSA